MHLIFATSIVPAGVPTTGYEIANAAIIDALRRNGVRVTVLGYIWPGAKPSDPDNTVVLGEVDVRTDNASGLQKVGWLLQAVQQGATFSSIKLRAVSPDEVQRQLKQLEPYDGYVVNAAQMAGAYDMLFADKPSVFVAHNVEYRSAEENAAAASNMVQKFLYAREARLLRGVERRLCDRSDFIWTLSEEDRRTLGIDQPSRSAALPMVVARGALPGPTPRERLFDAALIGTWTWQPNRIGLDWFLDEVTPHLPHDFTVKVAGKIAGGASCAHPGVEFVGFVPDATEFLRQSRVVPLTSRVGTGVQLKTIETFELGLPSVATTRSLRGISARPANCAVADDPAEFARALVAAARSNQPDVDGRGFHAAQTAELDRRIAAGLERLGAAKQGVAA